MMPNHISKISRLYLNYRSLVVISPKYFAQISVLTVCSVCWFADPPIGCDHTFPRCRRQSVNVDHEIRDIWEAKRAQTTTTGMKTKTAPHTARTNMKKKITHTKGETDGKKKNLNDDHLADDRSVQSDIIGC